MVVVLAAPAAGFAVVPTLFGFAVSADLVAAAASVFLSLDLSSTVVAWTAGEVGAVVCTAGAGVGASGSNVSMRSFDGLDGAAAAAIGADGAGVVSGTVLVASRSKSIRTPPAPPVPPLLGAGAAADCDIIRCSDGGPFNIGCASVQQNALFCSEPSRYPSSS